MVSVGQIIGLLFGILMVFLTWLSNYKKKISGLAAFFFYFLWMGWIVAILLFDQIKTFAKYIDIQVFDLFVYVAIIVLFILIFYLYIGMKETQKKIEEIVENVAIKDNRKK